MALFHSQIQNSLTARLFFQHLKTPQLNTFPPSLIQEQQHVTAASGAEISSHRKKPLKEQKSSLQVVFCFGHLEMSICHQRTHSSPISHLQAKLRADIYFLLPLSEFLHSMKRGNHHAERDDVTPNPS